MNRYIETLTNLLHNKGLSHGEPVDARTAAGIIVDFEERYGVRLSPSEILIARSTAAHRVVDSLLNNVCHSQFDSDEDRERTVARLEAMRPTALRTKEVYHILTD